MNPAEFSFFQPFANMFRAISGGELSQAQWIIVNLLNWLVVIFMIATFVYLVLAGIKYITSQGDATKATEARRAIIYAIIGIIVATLSLFIINATVSIVGTL